MAICREYNEFVASVAGEVAELRKVQAVASAEQMALDEASLQRLKAEEAKNKVPIPAASQKCHRWTCCLVKVPP